MTGLVAISCSAMQSPYCSRHWTEHNPIAPCLLDV